MINRILIADQSEIISRGIKSILQELDNKLDIREVRTWENLQKWKQRVHYNFIIFNYQLLQHDEVPMIRSNFGRSKKAEYIVYAVNSIPEQIKAQCFGTFRLDDEKKTITEMFENMLITRRQKRKRHGSSHLTRREEAVLRCIALGMTNKEIAEELFISTHTVIAHRKNITRKLAIKTVSGLTVYAILNKLVRFDEIE